MCTCKLKEKKIIKEADESLNFQNLQTISSDIEEVKSYVSKLALNSFGEDLEIIDIITKKLNFVSDILNKQIESETTLEEDVNMTLDQVSKEAEKVKKITDKGIEINLTESEKLKELEKYTIKFLKENSLLRKK